MSYRIEVRVLFTALPQRIGWSSDASCFAEPAKLASDAVHQKYNYGDD
jgi:hypothetical protein